ncbi:MAG: ABC-2 transporter permease [Gemmatimonadaceae bacterium]|nr:ABC-2 transporter permease [Gloeobacterales cyanobacterium ES-bin-141]
MVLQQIWALTWKDLKVLAVDRAALAILFLLPTIFLVVMNLALQGLYSQGNLPTVAVVNLDQGKTAERVLDQLTDSGSLRLERVRDRATAEERVKARSVVAAVLFDANFSRAVEAQATNRTGDIAIELIVDPAAPLQVVAPVRGAIDGAAAQTVAEEIIPMQLEDRLERVANSIEDPQARRLLPEILGPMQQALQDLHGGQVKLKSTGPAGTVVGEKRPDSLQQNVPAWTIFGIFFIVNVLALSILRERQYGTFTRLQGLPLSPVVLLAGKLLPFYLINLVQAALMFAIGSGILKLDLGSSPLGLVAITLAVAGVATSLGLLLATFFETPEQLGGIASLLVVVLAALGGILVPTFVMPDFMRTIALLTPQSWALEGYQNILLRGGDVTSVLAPVGVLVLFAAGFFTIAVWRLRSTAFK